ncbi:hypothetical protein EJD97_011743 [Solanum chilense]|uniref:Secreted protein n=1 Tax=Solanum chilense TaxID=4083 RepID=A0A6N2CGI4_SOLCI|nr:hypothetical protein EJD97_011743 [Solanum chilense]
MDRRILGLSVLTLMICSLLVTKTWADEDKNPEEAAAAADQNSKPVAAAAAVGATPKEPKGDDSDAHDSDENYVLPGGFNGIEDQFDPEIIVVGH